jgi:monoamine oxidase
MQMNRGEFLKKFSVLAVASPFIASLLSSCTNNKQTTFEIPSTYDGKIIVIGAGVTGITAGHILNQKNIDFKILGASSIHGGRVKKIVDFADFPIDVGAEWIHKWIEAKPPVLKNLLANIEPNFPTFQDNASDYKVWKNGKLKEPKILNLFSSGTNDFKFSNATWFDFFNQLVTPSLKSKIHYNSPVHYIDYSNDKIIVRTKSGKEYTANKVLVTVPIKILQNEFITFQPALPPKQIAAINKEQMPGGLKVFIEFSEKFYPEVLFPNGLLKGALGGNYMYYDECYGKDSSKNIMGLFAVGKPSEKYTSLKTDDAIINYILNELDEMFEGKASKNYVKHIVQNWNAEPFIQGSYSAMEGNPKKMSAPVANKIYFAGEAMNTNGHTIAVHGASESAYLTLMQMLKKKA